MPLPSAAVVQPANGRPGFIKVPTVARFTDEPTVACVTNGTEASPVAPLATNLIVKRL